MTEPLPTEINDAGPVAIGGGQVSVTAYGGPAAGRDVRIETFNQYVVEQGACAALSRSSGRCPYPGLRSFGDGWEKMFHGRERETERLLDLLVRSPVSAVVGSSGCGKSSLLSAGLEHALRNGALPNSERWTIRLLGASPLPVDQLCAGLRGAFEAAGLDTPIGESLPDPEALRADPALFGRLSAHLGGCTGGRVVWLLDQFESYLGPDQPAAEAACIARAVLSAREQASGTVHVMVAVRTDLYHRLESDPELAAEVTSHQFWLPPLTGQGLRNAVRQPASEVGVSVQDQLVDRIAADAADGPGTLPLIAYALERVWERDDSGELTLTAYEEIGGVAAALDQGAQKVWNSLDADGRATARRTLVRLAHVGNGERPTRQVVFARDLVTGTDAEPAVLAVVDSFVRERLLVVGRDLAEGEPTVEVAHEILLEKWQMLRQWLADEPEAKRLQDEIAAAAAQWLDQGRDEGFLLPPGRLRQLQRIDPEHWPLNKRELEYIGASRRAEEQIRWTRKRATVLRRRWLLTAVCLVLALAVAATAVWVQRRTEEAKTVMDALRLSAQARSAAGERRDVAALLAAAAVRTHDFPATRSALMDILDRQGGQLAVHRPRFEAAEPNVLATTPTDGGALVLGCSDGTLRLVDPVSGAPRGVFGAHHHDAVSAVALGGGLLVSGDTDGGVLVQRAARTDGEAIRLRPPSGIRVAAVAVDAKRGVVLAGGADGVVSRWQIRGRRAAALAPVRVKAAVDTIVVHRPGAVAAVTTSLGHVLEVPTTPDRNQVVSDTMLNAPEAGVVAAAAVGDGGLATVDGLELHLWDGPGDKGDTVAAPRTTAVVTVGRNVYTGDTAGRIRAWVASGVPRPRGEVLTGPPSDAVTGLATDGTLLAALTRGRRLVVWDLTSRASPAARPHLTSVEGVVTALSHGPAGTLATGDSTGTIRLTGPGPYSGMRLNVSRSKVVGVAWTGPAALAVATADGILHGVDLATRTNAPLMARPGSPLVDVRSGPDGTVAAAWDRQVLLHRPDGSTHPLNGLTVTPVRALALGPHGEVAVSAGPPTAAHVMLWTRDAATTRPSILTGHRLFVSALAFSPDGRTLATGSDDRTVALWDVRSGRRTAILSGHDDTIRALAWSNNQLLASGAEDGTVRLWNTQAPDHLGLPLRYTDDDVTALSATSNGRELVAANGRFTVEWPFAPSAWTALACAFAGDLHDEAQDRKDMADYASGTYPDGVCKSSAHH